MSKDYSDLEKLVVEWAEDKGILKNGNPIAQLTKTMEEVDELYVAIENNDRDEIIDALISGGRDSFELQNMDKEFRFWYEVKDELNRMKS